MDRLLDRNPRICRLVATDMVGLEVGEGNFTGGLGLLQSGAADLIFFHEATRYLVRDFFKVNLIMESSKRLNFVKTFPISPLLTLNFKAFAFILFATVRFN